MAANQETQKAESLRIFFGHQSVGYNIIDGITDISTNFNIIDNTSVPDSSSFFLHSQVGENTKPQTKLEEFADIVRQIGDKCDVVFLKFCYVDFSADTDVNKLFESYKDRITELKKEYPNLKIIHFTAPLTTIQTGPKALVKRLIGRSIGHEDNIQRQKYNELIRNEYSNNSIVFDIAEIESTKPDGSRLEHDKDEYVYYSLFEDYTNDGGHLNEEGRRIVAEKLIELLSEIK